MQVFCEGDFVSVHPPIPTFLWNTCSLLEHSHFGTNLKLDMHFPFRFITCASKQLRWEIKDPLQRNLYFGLKYNLSISKVDKMGQKSISEITVNMSLCIQSSCSLRATGEWLCTREPSVCPNVELGITQEVSPQMHSNFQVCFQSSKQP